MLRTDARMYGLTAGAILICLPKPLRGRKNKNKYWVSKIELWISKMFRNIPKYFVKSQNEILDIKMINGCPEMSMDIQKHLNSKMARE